MPVICNQRSTAPIIDGRNSFVSFDVGYLRQKKCLLEENRDLVLWLGKEARRYVVGNHSLKQFEKKWVEILELAAKRYEGGPTKP